MEVVSSWQQYKGKKIKDNPLGYSSGSLFQPLQFLPESEKTSEWAIQCMDFMEFEGIRQIRERANWMMKNYRYAIGAIERSDYIKEDNEYADMIGALEKQAGKPVEAMQLKDFSLAKTVINVIVDEFSKRSSHMSFDDKSPIAQNEMLEEKKAEIEQVLLAQMAIKQQEAMLKMGISADSDQGKQMLDPQTLKTLPQIQQVYTKSYRNIYQEWAQHQMDVDNDRFSMPELERMQFRNMLITDREFWHYEMRDNDYDLQAWNPPQVFYRKSPKSRYISDGSRVGYVEYLTIADVVDMDGYKMSEEQLLSLNTVHGAIMSAYGLDGTMQDNYWNKNQDYDWNRTGPGLGMRQLTSVLDSLGAYGKGQWNGDIIRQINNEGEDVFNNWGEYMVRRTTVYWKTQRKYYHLTKIDENGNLNTTIVGENYKVTDKPQYNTVLYKEKTKENLIFGEHLDPLWANEVWGGIRIGTNVPSIGWQGTTNTFAPIYLGINGGKPGRLPFQFKGDNNLYGCKLPVEGAIFNDHNTKSKSLIDSIKSWDLCHNMTMNILQDTMVNDLGVLIQLDPNALVKHSIGEDYGPDTLQSTMTIARDLSVIQAYGAGKNADGEHIGQHPVQRLDVSQTERLLGLAKIAEFFKMGCLDSVGLNPTRLGTPTGKEDTATGVQQDIAASYSHTEYLFTQHCDDLMPRVHQMRTDLAQYYNSTNPSVRLQYITANDERAFFEIDGTKLMGRDFNIKCTTRVNARSMLLQIKQLLMTNNTSGANLYDLARGMQIPTIAEMNGYMKQLEQRQQQEQQHKMQQEQQLAEQEQQHQMQLLQEKQQYEAEEADKDRQERIYIAEIGAAARAATARPSDAGEEAYNKGLDRVEQQNQFRETMNLNQQKHVVDTQLKIKDQSIQQQKIQAENSRTHQELQTAKIQAKAKDKEKKTRK